MTPPAREELIAKATHLHDESGCGCDPKYLMSCPNMANAVLQAGKASRMPADAAAAERERIKAAGAVSACCGTTYTRPRERYGRWTCDGCGRECDLIGVIG